MSGELAGIISGALMMIVCRCTPALIDWINFKLRVPKKGEGPSGPESPPAP
jgi:hypothetical protein